MIPDAYRRERIEVLFDQCSDLPPEQRGRFLDVAVAGDNGLRRDVEALLASADRADSSDRLERIVAAAFDLPRVPDREPGTGERYELLEKLGGGGMGVVYKGRDRESGRLVALKFLSESLAEDPVIRRRFHREARAAAALEHPNIGAIHGVEEQDGRLFLVMPFYGGGTLKARIAAGPLPIADAVSCAIQIAEGLGRRTGGASSTATSSPPTSSSRTTALSRSSTSASRRSGGRSSPAPGWCWARWPT